MTEKTSKVAGTVEELWATYEGLAKEREQLAGQADAAFAAYLPHAEAVVAAYEAGRDAECLALAERSEPFYAAYGQAALRLEVAMDAEEVAYSEWCAAVERREPPADRATRVGTAR